MNHGGELELAVRDYGIERSKWLDLSTGINPNGYKITDLAQSVFHHLPQKFERDELELTARACYSVPDGVGLISAPGTQFLIKAVPQLRAQSEVAIVSPTFSSHAAAWRRYGHHVNEIGSLDEIQDESVVVLVNPNNPDGRQIALKQLLALARTVTERNGLMIIDEAFADVVPDISFVPYHDNSNVIVLRSVGKFYGLAGLRLGFAIGPNRFLQSLYDLLGSWSVSGPAIEVGKQALSDQDWQRSAYSLLVRQADQHKYLFTSRGIKLVGGTPLFHLIEINDARKLHHQLALRGVWTRRFDYHSMWLRIGLCKTPADLKQFEMAFDAAYQAMQVAA